MENKEVKDLSVYKKKFDEDISEFREFEAMDYVKSLKNMNQLDEAIEVGKTFLEARPDLKIYINHYGYALFNKYIRNVEVTNEDTFYAIVDEILSLTKQERYSPYEATINAVIRHATQKEEVDWKTVHEYLEKLDPTALDKEPYIAEGKREGESKFERWYRLNVRACFEIEKYKRCIEIANQAMTLNIKWHHRNAYWIRLYRAKAHLILGQYEECEKEYLALQNAYQDANFYKDLYHIYKARGEIQKANTYLIYDVYMSGYDASELPLYNLLLEASIEANQERMVAILKAMISKFAIEAGQEAEVDVKYAGKDSGDLYDDMMDELTRHLDAFVPRIRGKVVHYNQEKQIGSIVTDETSTFFRQADFIYDEEVRRFERVDYTIINTYDNRKQAMTSKACLILEAEEQEENFNFGY